MSEPIDDAAWRTWEPPTKGQTMSEWQDGRCAMCGDANQRLLTDHCHSNGLVRGKLCHTCNIDEGFSPVQRWLAWRNWDNPAHAYGWVQVYEGRGGTPISPSALMTYMSEAEREAWWAEQKLAATEGREWPAPIVLSESGKRREAQFQRDLDFIAEAVTW